MSSIRSAICGFFMCGFIPLAVAADKAAPAEKRFELPSGEKLVIKWNAEWADFGAPPGVPPGTVTFSGPDASKMRVMIVPLPPNPNFTGDAGNLRILMSNLTREMEKTGQVNEPVAIEGPNMSGLYVKGVDPKPKPGEFTFVYAGPLSISKRAYVFQVVWNAGGEVMADKALAALKTVRIE